MADLLLVVAEPHRREILQLLQDNELNVGQICSNFDLSGPAISQHLRKLREAGLVEERRQAQERLYRASPEGLAELWRQLEAFWDGGLTRVRKRAEKPR